MDQQTYGFVPIRKCTPEEQKVIVDKYEEAIQTLQKSRCDQIYWINFYLNGQFCFQGQEKDKPLKQLAEKLIFQIQNGVPQQIIHFGFLTNPANNKNDQYFHYDYDRQFTNIFIPLTDLVYGNSMQFLEYPLKVKPSLNEKTLNYQNYAPSQKQLLEQQGVDFLTISQVICKPYVIIKLFPGTIHRGIQNRTGKDRTVLYIGYSKNHFEIKNEQTIGKGSL